MAAKQEFGALPFHFLNHGIDVFLWILTQRLFGKVDDSDFLSKRKADGSEFHADDSRADERNVLRDGIKGQEVAGILEEFFSRDIERDIGLAGPDDEIVRAVLGSIDVDRMGIDEFGGAFQNIEAEAIEQASQSAGEHPDIAFLISHEGFPGDFGFLRQANVLIALKRLFQFDGRIEKDLRIASVIGAGAAKQILFDQGDSLALKFQNQSAMPAGVAASDEYDVILFHDYSSFS